ncbi:MAG: aromatic ring-cleaving dioxygenase [Rhodospirillales bacterium]|nr:aromatic ring-cleaving dioxygenase [Rhodospirillales bacterium]
MTDPAVITGYHAHVYYNDADSRARAARLRDLIDEKFEVVLGRWRDEPVGPHPRPMYQVAFAADQFAALVPWLMLNRDGLTILVHPETGDQVVDHRDQPLWLGEVLDLNIAFLEAGNTRA